MRSQLAIVLSAAIALLAPAGAGAATIKVTATADEFNANAQACSLREAVWSANRDQAQQAPGCVPGSGTDRIAVPAGTYELAIAGRGEQAAASGDLDLTSALTIERSGPPGAVTIDGKGLDRVFEVNSVSGVVTISGVVVQGGHSSGGPSPERCGDVGSAGGGILVSRGALTLTDSTIRGNLADSFGGGVETSFTGSTNAVNATVSGNRARSDGGGLDNSGGNTTLLNVTVTANVAEQMANCAGGGGIGHFGGTTTLRSTIVAGNSERRGLTPDCYNAGGGSLASLGQTLLGNDRGCDFTASAGDITGVDPKLGPLADNGGPTPTHALLKGSPALEKGSGCAKSDQRGVPRTAGGACDIGAYELVRCQGRVADRIGTNRNDSLTGTAGADVFLLLGGDDRSTGFGGNDVACGAGGNDRMIGGLGNDRIRGDTGKDKLKGGRGDDILAGGRGKDKLVGGSGRDELQGGRSKDVCDAARGEATPGCERLKKLPWGL